ncbi:MAG TPA: hypothetical protein VGZ02_04245 [Candidatus Baltobacteraceae bacterium]|jgi:hypothetical protein|nr:hypothetical protein [Candidatus Baltobacteraceae bacterium]
MKGRSLAAASLALSLGGVAWAQPSGRCTREVLSIRGTPLTAAYCVASQGAARPGRDLPVVVNETFSTPRTSFSRFSALRFIAGEEASRVIEDVPLDRVGLEGTLHTTLLLRGGQVRIDSAVLTPGALTIK